MNDVAGIVHPGAMMAVMGASGAGKTTLLNTLNFRTKKSNELHIYGKVCSESVLRFKDIAHVELLLLLLLLFIIIILLLLLLLLFFPHFSFFFIYSFSFGIYITISQILSLLDKGYPVSTSTEIARFLPILPKKMSTEDYLTDTRYQVWAWILSAARIYMGWGPKK